MGKGHYHGGGTLIGFGTTSRRSKGGGRGLNLSSPADQQKARLAEKKRKKAIAAKIAKNEKIVKRLSDQWLAEKGRKHYERLVAEAREKTSPLAAALRQAMRAADDEDRD